MVDRLASRAMALAVAAHLRATRADLEFVPSLPPLPGAGALGGALPVTVMSVPTPYSDFSTSAWAFLTPAEAAVTVTTRPIPARDPAR